jgi:hypothetical protein
MSKFEITQVIKNTDQIENAMGNGKTLAIYTVKYRYRVNKKLSMDSEVVTWASDELEAYQFAQRQINDILNKESNNVIQDTRRT